MMQTTWNQPCTSRHCDSFTIQPCPVPRPRCSLSATRPPDEHTALSFAACSDWGKESSCHTETVSRGVAERERRLPKHDIRDVRIWQHRLTWQVEFLKSRSTPACREIVFPRCRLWLLLLNRVGRAVRIHGHAECSSCLGLVGASGLHLQASRQAVE